MELERWQRQMILCLWRLVGGGLMAGSAVAVSLSAGAAWADAPMCSCSREWVQTFRGNQHRSFYGTGYIPSKLKIRWRFRTRWIRDSRLSGYGGRKLLWRGTGWSGQPAVVGDRVWVSSVGGELYCLNRHTGRKLWSFRAGLSIKSSVTYWNNRVYFGSRSNRLYCLNAKTGKRLWQFHTPGKNIDSTPIVWKGVLYWGAEDKHLYAMNPLNGKIIWKYKTMGSIESSPMIHGDNVYINSYDGHLHCVDRKTGQLNWRFRTGDDTDTSPTYHRGHIYLGSENGKVFAVDAQTGELLWKRQTNGGVWSTPTVHGRRIFVGSNDRRFYSFDAETGRRLWKYRTGDGVWASAAYVDGRLVFGDWAGFVHVLRATDGERIDRIRLGMKYKADGNHIVSSASVVDGRVYLGSRDGHFYCFEGPRTRSASQKRMSRRWRRRFGEAREAVVTQLSSLAAASVSASDADGLGRLPAGLVRQRLLQALKSDKLYARLLVARLLRTRPLPKPMALGLLKYILQDGAGHIRLEGVKAAEGIGKEAAALIEPLLQDKDERLRAAACDFLGRWGNDQAHAKVEKLLMDRDAMVQASCAGALYFLGKRRKARAALRRLLFGGRRGRRRPRRGCPMRVSKYYLYRNSKGKVRRVPRSKQAVLKALLIMHKLGDTCATKHIFSRWYGCDRGRLKGYCTIYSDWQGWMKRLAVVKVIPYERARRQLRQLKRFGLPRYKDKNLRAGAYGLLARMKDPKRIPLLLKGLRSERYDVSRILIAKSLKGLKQSKVRKGLLRALAKDRNPDVRIAVAHSLAKTFPKVAVKALTKQLAKRRLRREKVALAAELVGLGQVGLLGRLKRAMKAPSRDARCHALRGLASSTKRLGVLQKALGSAERFIRLCAIRALVAQQPKGAWKSHLSTPAGAILQRAISHQDPTVALRATFATLR